MTSSANATAFLSSSWVYPNISSKNGNECSSPSMKHHCTFSIAGAKQLYWMAGRVKWIWMSSQITRQSSIDQFNEPFQIENSNRLHLFQPLASHWPLYNEALQATAQVEDFSRSAGWLQIYPLIKLSCHFWLLLGLRLAGRRRRRQPRNLPCAFINFTVTFLLLLLLLVLRVFLSPSSIFCVNSNSPPMNAMQTKWDQLHISGWGGYPFISCCLLYHYLHSRQISV